MVGKNINKDESLVAKAIAKSLKTSSQKANLVLKQIRGQKVENAMNILEFSRKRISIEVLKVLKSAVSNAENNHQLDIDKLFVKEATVGKSMVLKRFRPRARGRSGKILKPISKIRILVEERDTSMKNEKKKENLKKSEVTSKVDQVGDVKKEETKNTLDQIKENEKKIEASVKADQVKDINKEETNNTLDQKGKE